MSSSTANNRASLLAGLRTGGVRSASQPSIMPHTAAPGGSFNVPRFSSFSTANEEEEDELADMIQHNLHIHGNQRMMQHPATAGAADDMSNRFQQQQQQAVLRQMALQRAAISGMPVGAMNGMNMNMGPHAQAQAQLQMQVVQMEIMKLQALQQAQQVQQYQAELMAAEAQRQQAFQQRSIGRRPSAYGEPATAGPTNMTFDLRGSRMPSATYGGNANDDAQVPMTAALGGKFGSRSTHAGLNPNANVFTLRGESNDEVLTPTTGATINPRTTVISGGTALGSSMTPSKSDSALSWRRASRIASDAPSVKLSPPSGDDEPLFSPLKSRPTPLRFGGGSAGLAGVAVDSAESEEYESDTSYSSDLAQITSITGEAERDSSPSTPPSAGSGGSLSREEASKKLYEGLGMGRPAQSVPVPLANIPLRQLSQPVRQPRGPPASVDELGARNFASRLPMTFTIGDY